MCAPGGRSSTERLAEYGLNMNRYVLARKCLSRASTYCYIHDTQRRTVSSNSKSPTVLFQHYSANLSSTAVFLLKIPDCSVESVDQSQFGRRSREVSNTMLRCSCSKSRLWNRMYESPKYGNGRKKPGWGAPDSWLLTRAILMNPQYQESPIEKGVAKESPIDESSISGVAKESPIDESSISGVANCST